MQNPTLAKARPASAGRISINKSPVAPAMHPNPPAVDETNATTRSLPFAHKRWFVANPRIQDSALND